MIKLNKKEVKFGKFPNGETHLPIEDLNVRQYNRVEWSYEGDEDFFKLALLKGHLTDALTKVSLLIHYMPHSRMDRLNDNYAVSVWYAAKFINSMNFDFVEVMEPHSDVTPAVLENCVKNNWVKGNINTVLKNFNADTLFYPDAGAAKRYTEQLGKIRPYAVGQKLRDFLTGEITDFDLTGEVGHRVLITDDMCSKGGTFVHSAKLLKKHGAGEICLMVAYCENTVFTGELFEHIDMLYVSKDTVLDQYGHSQITLI